MQLLARPHSRSAGPNPLLACSLVGLLPAACPFGVDCTLPFGADHSLSSALTNTVFLPVYSLNPYSQIRTGSLRACTHPWHVPMQWVNSVALPPKPTGHSRPSTPLSACIFRPTHSPDPASPNPLPLHTFSTLTLPPFQVLDLSRNGAAEAAGVAIGSLLARTSRPARPRELVHGQQTEEGTKLEWRAS